MSQRTHGRTTGGARRNRPEPDPDTGAEAAPPRPAACTSRGRTASPDASSAARGPTPAHRSAKPSAGAAPSAAQATQPLLDPSALARTLRAVADELDRDPELASRVAAASGLVAAPSTSHGASADGPAAHAEVAVPSQRAARAFHPRLVTGTAAELGTGIPDPFTLRARLGRDGLVAVLAELRLGTLRAIIREHGLDPSRRLAQQNDAERLRAAILAATDAR